MESQTMINLNKSIYANNSNLLVDAVKKLEKLSNETKDKMIISRIKDIIEIMNKIINNNQQIRKDIEKLKLLLLVEKLNIVMVAESAK